MLVVRYGLFIVLEMLTASALVTFSMPKVSNGVVAFGKHAADVTIAPQAEFVAAGNSGVSVNVYGTFAARKK